MRYNGSCFARQWLDSSAPSSRQLFRFQVPVSPARPAPVVFMSLTGPRSTYNNLAIFCFRIFSLRLYAPECICDFAAFLAPVTKYTVEGHRLSSAISPASFGCHSFRTLRKLLLLVLAIWRRDACNSSASLLHYPEGVLSVLMISCPLAHSH